MSVEHDREFTDFVRAASPGLLTTAWLICGDPVHAEELVQAALERVYVKWGRVRRSSPVAYTRRVMLNLHIDHGRRRSREVVRPDPPERGSWDDGPEDHDLVVRLLRELPPRERQAVVLRHYVGLPAAEAADLLGCSVGTVKSSASRGLARLRQLHDREETSHAP